MDEQTVVFKGTKNGVTIAINGDVSYEAIKAAIEKKLNKSRNFFSSGKLYMELTNTSIDEEQQARLRENILEDHNLLVESIKLNKPKTFIGIYEGKTRFIRNTIRSGQDVEYPGNIVIIGDVNAGGHVKAEGNIVVLGSLRGVAHGGSSGNEKAIIAAYSLQPTQIRIADIISRAPDGELLKPKCPEMARIKDGCIVIEPYVPNKYY